MNNQSGRSLIELIGVMAIGGVMAAGAIGIYTSVHNEQRRAIAAVTMQDMVQNIKLLMESHGSYEGISIDYLVKAGALRNTDAPIGDKNWSVTPTLNGTGFMINLVGLSMGDCDYFETAIPSWATTVRINGNDFDGADNCFSSKTNNVTFIIE